jgi:hypothetical protein
LKLPRSSRILFVSHDAGRNGAPIMLLHFLRWLRVHTNLEFSILLAREGPLVDEFRAVGETIVNKVVENRRWHGLIPVRFAKEAAKKVVLTKECQRELSRLKPSLIYANTIANGTLIEALGFNGAPVLTHVHELEYWIQRLGKSNLDLVKRHTTHYVAAAEAVKENLVRTHGIPQAKISGVWEFIETNCTAPGFLDTREC